MGVVSPVIKMSHAHKHLQGAAVRVHALFRERVERVSESCLSNKLKSRPSHPVYQVDFLGTILERTLDCRTKLKPFPCQPSIEHTCTYKMSRHLVRYFVEDRNHLPHVIDIERRVEHLPLLTMSIACMYT